MDVNDGGGGSRDFIIGIAIVGRCSNSASNDAATESVDTFVVAIDEIPPPPVPTSTGKSGC